MENNKYILESVMDGGTVKDVVARSDGENVTVRYNGEDMSLDEALALLHGRTGFTTDGTLALSEDKVLSVVNPVKGVSKSEYAGLTAAQKAGLVAALDSEYDTLYLNGRELVPCPITDASDIYSTSETVVGKWIDGKLLYRKVIVLNNVSVTTSARNLATLSYSTLVSLTGIAKNGSIWWSMGGTEYLATSGSNITLSATSGGWSIPTLYITAIYTK